MDDDMSGNDKYFMQINKLIIQFIQHFTKMDHYIKDPKREKMKVVTIIKSKAYQESLYSF